MKRALLIIGGTVGGLGAVLSITPPQLGTANPGAVTALGTGSNSLGSTTQSTPAAPQTTTPSSAPASSSTAVTSPPATTRPASTTSTTSTPSTQPTSTTVKKKPTTAPVAHTTTKTPAAPSTATATSTPTQTPTPTKTATSTPTPTPTPTKTTPPPAPVSSGISGTFTGASYDANQGGRIWGRVTVTVTLNNGAISNINAVQSPSSRSYNAFSALTPAVVGQMTPKNVMAISPASLFAQISGRTGASYSAQAYWESLQSALTKAGV